MSNNQDNSAEKPKPEKPTAPQFPTGRVELNDKPPKPIFPSDRIEKGESPGELNKKTS